LHYILNQDQVSRVTVEPSATVIKKIQPDDEVIYVDNAYPLFSDVDGNFLKI
jgi:hypothetical protein